MVFYDIDRLAERAVKGDTVYEKCFPGFYNIMLETFHRGVSLYYMAQKTKKRSTRVKPARSERRSPSGKTEGIPMSLILEPF
mmetsp:Transcript_13097/g.31006  ORF Transcript_13097/g.31006 Transcript_13097/m.31006 type:complete len:82 (+) Transcript_13097:71-316(+)